MQLNLLYSTTKHRASEPIPWRGIFVAAALLWEQTTMEQVPHFLLLQFMIIQYISASPPTFC